MDVDRKHQFVVDTVPCQLLGAANQVMPQVADLENPALMKNPFADGRAECFVPRQADSPSPQHVITPEHLHIALHQG
jgi:hypothetical protein